MNNRSYALMLNGFCYSILTVVLIASSIIRNDSTILNMSAVTFIMLSLSILLSVIIEEESGEVPKGILVFSFIILLPLGILVFIFTFITSFVQILINKKITEGGDNDG